ncbi:MAG: signal peptidase I [Bifidobacterium sp.]|uniref:Signal peptidase I n=1 Tax=Bifidobacterium fermentum TaxID=3059035 RepID=A0AB39UG83_9BIFI
MARTAQHVEENKGHKTRSRIATVLTNLVLIASLALLACTAFFTVFLASKDLTFFGYKPYVISSESMAPEYLRYDVVIIKSGGYDQIRKGEVIAFRAKPIDNEPAFHRVVSIAEAGITTKGDANTNVDRDLVTTQNLLGREVFKITILRYLIPMLSTPQGIFFVVVLPVLFLIVLVIFLHQLRMMRIRQVEQSNAQELEDARLAYLSRIAQEGLNGQGVLGGLGVHGELDGQDNPGGQQALGSDHDAHNSQRESANFADHANLVNNADLANPADPTNHSIGHPPDEPRPEQEPAHD